jgi:acylphosphatase
MLMRSLSSNLTAERRNLAYLQSKMVSMAAARFVIRGRVQGVGFRNFVREAARGYGVSGEVWNRSDGAVEAVAEHSDPGILEAFAAALESGPGYIRDLQVEPATGRGYGSFEVGPTR